jgi:hypothetical protein
VSTKREDAEDNWVLLGHPCKQGVLAIRVDAAEDHEGAGWQRTFCVCLDAGMMLYEHERAADDPNAEPLALVFWLECVGRGSNLRPSPRAASRPTSGLER